MPLRISFLGQSSRSSSSTVTLANSPNNNAKKKNKLRRHRRSCPLRIMSAVAGDHVGDDAARGVPSESVLASDTPTLLNFGKTEDKDAPADSRIEKSDATASLPHAKEPVPDDPQTQVIHSLRAQIEDLVSQVTQLNGKLVKSYDRVSSLEDELHIAGAHTRTSALRISELEVERAQHVAALTTGLYVERAHVTGELTRLMERATSEAAARGQAESARAEIEHELDDLSANLFAQANSMVVEARLARATSEGKATTAERSLRVAEEALAGMQHQLQMIRDEKEHTADEVARLRARMEKGKFVEQTLEAPATTVQLLKSIMPYHEFLHFIAHIRSLRLAAQHMPPISTLLPLPFLSRLQVEDSEPTLRLDIAPSLNWLSRRSILSAVYCGQLMIEPVPLSTLLLESGSTLQSMIPSSGQGLSCALCGVDIFTPKLEQVQRSPSSLTRNASSSWSTSLFKNPLSNSVTATPSPTLTSSPDDFKVSAGAGIPDPLSTVHVFHLAPPQVQSSFQNAPQTQNAIQKYTNYPICSSGWCLARLRSTCSLWAFVRAGIIDRVWEERASRMRNPAITASGSISSASVYSNPSTTQLPEKETQKPTNEIKESESIHRPPPRRRSKIANVSVSVGNLWNMASGALRSQSQISLANTTKDKDKQKDPESQSVPKISPGTDVPPLPARIRVDTNEPSLSATRPPPLPTYDGEPQDLSASNFRPPLPERNFQQSASGSQNEIENKALAGDTNSITTEKTPVPNRINLPPPIPIQSSMSLASSAFSGVNDEFSTPVEEFANTKLPSVPSSPRRSRHNSHSSPRSPPPPRSPRSPSGPPSRPPSRSDNSPAPLSISPRLALNSNSPPPLSPRMAPLPDSRPGSPLYNSRSHPGSYSDSGTTSVAPLNIGGGSLVPLRVARESILGPVRSPSPSGPRPPPVPKRAAARRSTPSRPGSAIAQGTQMNGEAREERRVSIDSGQDVSEPGATVSEDDGEQVPPSLPPQAELASATQPLKPEDAPNRDLNSSDGSVMPISEDTRIEKTQARARVPANADVQNCIATHELTGSGSGDSEGEKRDVAANEDADANANSDTKIKNPTDTNTYVGDASWEERTWREIIRLREDMFWARLGALRG